MIRIAAASLFFGLCSLSFGQGNVLSLDPTPVLKAKAGTTVEAKVSLQLRQGYHVNSNTPSDEYLIPLKLTFNPGILESAGVVYPKPLNEKYSFSATPLSVFSGSFDLIARFKVPATASMGATSVTGKLRYQACNDTMCLPPKNLDVVLQVDVVK